jgi:cytochrome bd ubiquinol oxidase subunit II
MIMAEFWYCILAALIALYVVLDGFDLGVGILHLQIAKSETERRASIRSISPFWDGNEVWLLAAGGTMFFAFPWLYASSLSGFYLPLMIVLWLLILRAIAIEFRNHIESPVWKPLWDTVFSAASGLLALVFGAAIGNVVRGVPLDASGRFFEPLWTDFRPGPDTGIIDWYTAISALTALSALGMHGALWLVWKTEGQLQQRARLVSKRLWGATIAFSAILTGATFLVQPNMAAQLGRHPWGWLFPLTTIAGLWAVRSFTGRQAEGGAFMASSLYLLGMIASAAFGVFPYVLPSTAATHPGLTLYMVAAPDASLKTAFYWFTPGMILVVLYFRHVYRQFAGKVMLEEEGY